MSDAARKILQDVLALPEDERLELASEIIASVDGPRDADWDAAWLAELDRRAEAQHRGESGADWNAVRARVLERLRNDPKRSDTPTADFTMFLTTSNDAKRDDPRLPGA